MRNYKRDSRGRFAKAGSSRRTRRKKRGPIGRAIQRAKAAEKVNKKRSAALKAAGKDPGPSTLESFGYAGLVVGSEVGRTMIARHYKKRKKPPRRL